MDDYLAKLRAHDVEPDGEARRLAILESARYEVRVSDQREAPQWMREGCEVHTGDLRDFEQARIATEGGLEVIMGVCIRHVRARLMGEEL